jgi:hypothetical protein
MIGNASAPSRHQAVSTAYRDAMVWTSVAWVLLLGCLLTTAGLAGELPWAPRDGVVIAIGSLLVAYLSMLPGLRLKAMAGKFYGALLAGITIRLLGTVALFLTCRYQLASSAETVAGMTIGWYAMLTSVEVFALSRRLPILAAVPPVAPLSDAGLVGSSAHPTSSVRHFDQTFDR